MKKTVRKCFLKWPTRRRIIVARYKNTRSVFFEKGELFLYQKNHYNCRGQKKQQRKKRISAAWQHIEHAVSNPDMLKWRHVAHRSSMHKRTWNHLTVELHIHTEAGYTKRPHEQNGEKQGNNGTSKQHTLGNGITYTVYIVEQ